MKKFILLAILLSIISYSYSQKSTSKNKKNSFLLSSILFESKTSEFGYFYTSKPAMMFAVDDLEKYNKDPLNPSNNSIDSIVYKYDNQYRVSSISVFRKNTTIISTIEYQDDNKVSSYQRVSSKKDLYNEDINFNYKYSGQTIEIEDLLRDNANTGIIKTDKTGKLISYEDLSEGDNYVYKYNTNGTLKNYTKNRSVTFNFGYAPQKNHSNFGNTPQWLCLLVPEFWFINSQTTMYSVVAGWSDIEPVTIKYMMDYYDRPYMVTETDKSKNKIREYVLNYIDIPE